MQAPLDSPSYDPGLTNPLQETLKALESRSSPLTAPEILAFLQDLARHQAPWAPFERFDEASYCRRVVVSNGVLDLLLLTWRPGQRSPIHDHSGSTCGFAVVRGEALEVGFTPLEAGPLVPTGHQRLETGRSTVRKDSDIHLVGNFSAHGDDLVTLHLYSPPLASMRVYGEHETFLAGYSEVVVRTARAGSFHEESAK